MVPSLLALLSQDVLVAPMSNNQLERIRIELGTCRRARCGRDLAAGSRIYCLLHAKEARVRTRLREGWNRWKPGGRGQPPITA